jgi:hypothetical protein
MARKKKSAIKEKQSESRSSSSKIAIDPHIQRVIFALVAGITLFIIGMGYAGYAGWVGGIITKAARFMFGWAMWFIPVLVAIFMFRVLKSSKEFYVVYGIGSVLTSVVLSGMLAIFDGEASRGGMLGKLIAIPLLKLFGPWASFVVLLGVFIGGFLLVFDALPFLK